MYFSQEIRAVGEYSKLCRFNAENEEIYLEHRHMYPFDCDNLFRLLRILKSMYTKVWNKLRDYNEIIDNIQSNIEHLINQTNVFYQTESELRTEE